MLLDDCVALNLFVVVVVVGVVVGFENVGGPGGPAGGADERGKDAPRGGRGAGGGCVEVEVVVLLPLTGEFDDFVSFAVTFVAVVIEEEEVALVDFNGGHLDTFSLEEDDASVEEVVEVEVEAAVDTLLAVAVEEGIEKLVSNVVGVDILLDIVSF